MSKEDRELVFRDLSARLPYGVRVKVWTKDGLTEEGVLDLAHNYGDVFLDAFYLNKIADIKPYLRPMSDMTEEEKDELRGWGDYELIYWLDDEEVCFGDLTVKYETLVKLMDWLNANHLDYRGLIGKGLAMQAQKGMYDIK